MKIFQLIDWLTKLFKLNNKSKVILLMLMPLGILAQNNAAFWLGKRAAVTGETDPYFSNVSLLLHMDGVNGSTTFTDNSNNNFTVTANGNAQISTAQSKFGGASGYFDGTGDFIEVGNSQEFNMGSGDFTVEGWINLNNKTTSRGLIYFTDRLGSAVGSEVSFAVEYSASPNAFRGFIYSGSTIYQVINTTTVNTNTWHHLAFIRNGNTLNLFVDGVSTGTTTFTGTVNYTTSFTLNNLYFLLFPRPLNGYIDDLRITKGVARYTSNFTPPTTPFPDN